MKKNKQYIIPITTINSYYTKNGIMIGEGTGTTSQQLGRDVVFADDSDDNLDEDDFTPNLWED